MIKDVMLAGVLLGAGALAATVIASCQREVENHRAEPAPATRPAVEERRVPNFDVCDESTYTYIWNETQGDPFFLCVSYGYGVPATGGTWIRCWGPDEELAKTAFVSAPIIVMPYELSR